MFFAFSLDYMRSWKVSIAIKTASAWVTKSRCLLTKAWLQQRWVDETIEKILSGTEVRKISLVLTDTTPIAMDSDRIEAVESTWFLQSQILSSREQVEEFFNV